MGQHRLGCLSSQASYVPIILKLLKVCHGVSCIKILDSYLFVLTIELENRLVFVQSTLVTTVKCIGGSAR